MLLNSFVTVKTSVDYHEYTLCGFLMLCDAISGSKN